MLDRHDELLAGLYTGTPPTWIPTRHRALFERDSLRRRSDLCRTMKTHWGCTAFYAASLRGDEFAWTMFRCFPETRFRARSVTQGIHAAIRMALDRLELPKETTDLFAYESLALDSLELEPDFVRSLSATLARQAGISAPSTVYAFGTRVASLHARLTLYAWSGAPRDFARQCPVETGATYVARTPRGSRWVLDDVTDRVEAVLGGKREEGM